ncbi:hypothetical protein TrispH2_003981 [Trichoplax sp. H2]|nr:hypothetical protein TrispH2_003981 [Trichoplax sp. H2]|eukprot:RDD43356.1 hypothetical protein TrispH2_003981 [Trichoplax sp. H2]
MHRSLEQNSPGNHGPDGHLSFNLQQTDPQNTFAIASKISLALAILRMKPAGISASDFTLQICRYYKTKENWKNQIESLQIQAMSYQQEILQTWNQEHSQETETDTSEEVCMYQRYPSNTADHSDVTYDESKIRNYISFLQTIITASSIVCTPGIDSYIVSKYSAILCNIGNAVQGITDMIKESEFVLPANLVKRAIDNIIKVLNESNDAIVDKNDVLAKLTSLANTFFQRLKDTSKMGIKCNNTESYIEILVTMNEIPDVRIAVLSQLLEYTLEFSRYLQESATNLHIVDIHYCDKASYVLKTFGLILTKYGNGLSQTLKQQLFQGLDECGILIGREFPLVSGYIWTFLGLLDASLMS